jgi:hypothetical protein
MISPQVFKITIKQVFSISYYRTRTIVNVVIVAKLTLQNAEQLYSNKDENFAVVCWILHMSFNLNTLKIKSHQALRLSEA